MKIHKYIWCAVVMFFLYGCFDDKGNYDYTGIPEVKVLGYITNEEELGSFWALTVGDVVEVEPILEYTGDSTALALKFEWIAENGTTDELKTIGFGKKLVWETDMGGFIRISLFITVGSVALIIICCSMCAWYITRVHTKVTKTIYVLCLFSMIVPFQMVMFTLSKFANLLHLSNPLGIIVVYLGFGAGLAVFMFTGFVKGISLEIEEAAMIDGCTPLQTFFKVVFPILKPTTVTVAILEAMWVWNDYLLPSLVLNINKYKTIPIAIQFLKQSHGQIDWGAMMAVLVLAILPIIIFYIVCQKYIIEGVLAGAVKG